MTREIEAAFAQVAGLSGSAAAHRWQVELCRDARLQNRLIRIPTGMGKTFGVLAAWLWHRLGRDDPAWPRRLVWCLPMRVLVEQVADEIRKGLDRMGGRVADVLVHPIMGGVEAGEWALHPDRCAVLVGTQDMLLSRALNRGYGAARARWPMEFGLLNQDCLWVMDEVQLMDVGLTTSAQLQAFRDDLALEGRSFRPTKTWWMSATLQADWLTRSPDTASMTALLPPTVVVPPALRSGLLWDGVSKPVSVHESAQMREVAALVVEKHVAGGSGRTGPTLVVLNRVERAVEVFREIEVLLNKTRKTTDLRLVHSRFRPVERMNWRAEFLNRDACRPGTDRIVVATQVVEAGVDISAAVLVTELAPWPSLVQRFGRAARWGGSAEIIVVDGRYQGTNAAPYEQQELDAARQALTLLADVSPRNLEGFEEARPDLLPALYPYAPRHLILRTEVDDLFDTSPDLSGSDIDISRFIRSGLERDVQVFWRTVAPEERPQDSWRARREELCSVPFTKAREWICGAANDRLKPGKRAWVWDWLDGRWRMLQGRDIHPGQTILVDGTAGGYDPQLGWSPGNLAPVNDVEPLEPVPIDSIDLADASESDESLSATASWETIAHHGMKVGSRARFLAEVLVPSLAPLLDLAGRWHDAGKAHPAFQGSLTPHAYGKEIAKAPEGRWLTKSKLYNMPDGSRRHGFRHELVSSLALFALLHRCEPNHPALLGPWRELLEKIGQSPAPAADEPGSRSQLNPLEREIVALDADSFDLLLYLVCCHHGKVRVSWQSSPADQASNDSVLRIRGVRTGDTLPALSLVDTHGERHQLPPCNLDLAPASVGLNAFSGAGWTERVLALLQRHGPFSLAWLEALVRCADQQASSSTDPPDPSLAQRPGDPEGPGQESAS